MLSSEMREIIYTGTDDQSVYSYPFYLEQADDLVVIVTDLSGENAVTLTRGTHYTVFGVGSQAGYITLLGSYSPLESDERLIISRTLDYLQVTDLINQGSYWAQNHEAAFDRFVMMAQQLRDDFLRTISYPHTGIDTTPFDADGRRIANVSSPLAGDDAATLGDVETVVAQYLAGGQAVPLLSWTGVGNGSTVRFGISGASSSSSMLYLVSLSGVIQTPETDYTIDAQTWEVVFDEAPETGADVLVRELGYGKGMFAPKIYDGVDPPTATSSNCGNVIIVRETGQPDIVKMCLRNADASYSWNIIHVAEW